MALFSIGRGPDVRAGGRDSNGTLRVGGAGGEQNGDERDSEVFHGSLIGTTYDTSRPGEGGRATSRPGEIERRRFPGPRASEPWVRLGPWALGLGSGFQTNSADTRCGISPFSNASPKNRSSAARPRVP